MVGEYTHITSRRCKVHLNDIGGGEDSLQVANTVNGCAVMRILLARTWWGSTRDKLILSAASA